MSPEWWAGYRAAWTDALAGMRRPGPEDEPVAPDVNSTDSSTTEGVVDINPGTDPEPGRQRVPGPVRSAKRDAYKAWFADFLREQQAVDLTAGETPTADHHSDGAA